MPGRRFSRGSLPSSSWKRSTTTLAVRRALLGRTGHSDVIDAALVALAPDGDEILTSDPEHLATLARARGVHVDVVRL